MARDLYETVPGEGRVRLHFHPGQLRAWNSRRRFVAVLAGTQGGKTSWLPWWLWREIQARGSGDYLAVTSTFDLFKLKFLPTIRDVFENVLKIGRYWSGNRVIEIADPETGEYRAKSADDPMYARIILRSAQAGSGLESSTAKGAILDEAGQDEFTVETWEAIRRRLILNRGRCCLGTTLYNFGWLKSEIYDRWAAGDPDIDVIRFDSTENPAFPPEEFADARAKMPEWRFNMQYRGMFERPAGQIYDSFDEKACVIPPFAINPAWPRYLGLDFGGVNTAGVFYAEEPLTGRLVAYREYKAGGRTAEEHARYLLENEPMPTCVGGSKSEGQWRAEFRKGGLPVREPDVKEVEIGIGRVYGAHKQNQIFVFNTLQGYLKEKKSYSRKLDASGLPTEEIEDKSTSHFMDAERYIVGWKFRPVQAQEASVGGARGPIPGVLAAG